MKNHSMSAITRLLQTAAARSGTQGRVCSYIMINLQIRDVSRRYQPALSSNIQNKQLYLPQSHCLSCFHSRFTFIRSTFRSKDKLKLSLGRASAERKTAVLIGRKPSCFRRFRLRASQRAERDRGAVPRRVVFWVLTHPGHCPLSWYGLRSPFRSPLARQTAV